MTRDPDVVFLGEDVAKAGGVFKATVGLLEKFGPLRVRDTPISEQAILGVIDITGLKWILVDVSYREIDNKIPRIRDSACAINSMARRSPHPEAADEVFDGAAGAH